MSRWNILHIRFFGLEGRHRTINLKRDVVNVLTGASGTGKTAIIEAIDYCLGSSSCNLPWYVRRHAEAVAVHWANGDLELIVGRKIPKEGKGTEQMFVRTGKSLRLPNVATELEGPTPRDAARAIIERAFGIADIEDADAGSRTTTGRASVRHVTPYLFLSGDVIVSKNTLLHDMNRADKVRDIKATMPYFLGAVDQESVLAERRLRQLEAAYGRLEREAKAKERSKSKLTERSMALLSQAAAVGLAALPAPDASEQFLLNEIRTIANADIESRGVQSTDDLGALEEERQSLVMELTGLREKRRSIKRAMREAEGYETAVSGQSHKLALVDHLKLDDGRCPICSAETDAGQRMAAQIRSSLNIISAEVAAVFQVRPEIVEQASKVDAEISSKSERLREIEEQISALIRLTEAASRAATLAQARALVIGRASQFIETTIEDFESPAVDLGSLREEIATLRDRVDLQAKRDRLRDAENMISNFATTMLAELPTEVPAAGARMLFIAEPKVSLIEPNNRSVLSLGEIGSDQNYLSIHLALSFALQKHFETRRSPVPGLLVIDQISRPYYPGGGSDDEKRLADMELDSDRLAMRQIVNFLFDETMRRQGLQVLLIEHAYIDDDERYVAATVERWTKASGEKLIPTDWPSRP